MECQKTFNAPNKNLDKTDSGASLSVRLKFKGKKKTLHSTMKVCKEKTRDQERFVYAQMRTTLYVSTEQGKTSSITLGRLIDRGLYPRGLETRIEKAFRSKLYQC